MRPVLFLILAGAVVGGHAALTNFYDIGDEEECPTGSRCMPVDLCPGAAQPVGPYGRGVGVGVGVGHGWVPRRRYPARCASVLPGARVCCWSPYQPRFRPVRQAPAPAPASPSQRACAEFRARRSQPRSQIPSNQVNLSLFVVGGQLALEEEFPYMVAIGYLRGSNSAGGNLVWGCGGSLISDRYVLTAAHCITDAQRFNLRPAALRMGVNNLTQGPQLPTDYSVANVTLHPRHRGDLKYFDLALVRTDRPVSFTARQQPVCLEAPDTRIDARTRLVAAGWGAVDPEGIDRSDSLKKANLRVVEMEECRTFIQQRRDLPRGLDDTMICAAEPQRQADTCTGDSGGPLAARGPEGDVLVGVTSFGGRPCASRTPGVYARVKSELSWIESIVWS
ncbi:hypothetical protein R5R35_012683 [Gryllus longicercus]